MKLFFSLFALLIPLGALADESVLFEYVLEEEMAPDDVTTSQFGFLVNFDKAASADIGDTAKLDVVTQDLGEKVRVYLTLHDYIDGDLTEVGRGSVDVLYGANSRIAWYGHAQQRYELSISPKRYATN